MPGVIQIGGLATGLDTNKIIDQLVKIERRPLDLLQAQIDSIQANKDSVSSLGAKLATLRTVALGLGSSDRVLVRKANSSDEGVLTAAAGAGAPRGSTTINVTQLARGSVAGSASGVASTDTTIATGAGTFSFHVGSGTTQSVAVDATTTLQQLADGINALGAGVTASAVNLGTSTAPDYRLQLVSNSTGSASTLTVDGDGTSLGVATSQTGLDAQFTLSGFTGTFSRESNTFSDVLPGVTISLVDTGTATVTVNDDTGKISDQVEKLVAAFNDVIQFVAEESTVQAGSDGKDPKLGTLAADTTVKRVVAQLHQVFSGALSGATTKFVNLSSLGLATQQDGTIAFDKTKFEGALAADPNAVAEVFGGNGTANGIANDLASYVGDATSSAGILGKHTSGLDDEVRSLQDRIDEGERQVERFQEGLVRQFTAMEKLVSTLQSQQAFLASSGL
jgi:flagellar hook-associated protein 2